VRFYADTIEEIALHLAQIMEGSQHPYQALDASAMPVRDVKRRGHGWLAGYADIGWSNSLGWYEGFSLLSAVEPSGVITGFCFGAASTADQPLAETFFDVRANPNPRLKSVGSAFSGTYVADKGFEGVENRRRWLESYGADVIHPPKRNSRKPWSKRLRRWIASIRQIVESVYDKLFNTFGRGGSGPMNFRACGRGWRRGWRCTTSASGSTINSVVPDWPSLICWDGELTVHTKRLRIE
jgi:hypothetical protein